MIDDEYPAPVAPVRSGVPAVCLDRLAPPIVVTTIGANIRSRFHMSNNTQKTVQYMSGIP